VNILVGSDNKSTAAGLIGLAGQISTLFTIFMSVVALQVPGFSWVWAILSAFAVFLFGCYRAWIMYKMNYLQADPNTVPQANPQVVSVVTAGPIPEVVKPVPADPKIQ
jgi:hypothetical protein